MKESIWKNKYIIGALSIILGILVYSFRPAASCAWYEFGCKAGGLFTSPIFLVISLILIIFGVVKIVRKG